MVRRARTGTDADAPDTGALPASTDPISIGLKYLFGTVADEPVPAEFLQLLDRIDAQDSARAASAGTPTSGEAR